MNAAAITSVCFECGRTMEGRRENYRYVESGLDSVVLRNVLVFHCKHCGAAVPQIVAANILHRLIAIRLLTNEYRLSGAEVRFLRKAVGYSATELAKMAGSSKQLVSRWENRSSLGQDSDRLIRLLCAHKMMRDSLLGVDPLVNKDGLLAEAQELVSSMEDTLRKIHKKKAGKKQQYFIDPGDLSKYGHANLADLDEHTAAQLQ
jgi:YgiT-type zinc finger domain-containing protein